MNALEHGGKALQGFVESLKSQPLSLALVVMNCSFAGVPLLE